MALKVVLFDVGGTLINYPIPLPESGRLFHSYREEAGLSEKVVDDWISCYLSRRNTGFKTAVESTFLSALKYSAENNGLKLPERELLKILDFYYRIAFRPLATMINGARELLDYVKSRGIPMGIISNTAWPGRFHEEDLLLFDIKRYFEIMIWSSEERLKKPHMALFLRAIGHSGVDNKDAIYLGDTFDRDVIGANGIGIPAIWISDKEAPEGHKEWNGWQVKDLFEAKEILSKIE